MKVMWISAPYNIQKYQSIGTYFPDDVELRVVSGALAFNGKIPLLGQISGNRHWFMPNMTLLSELRRYEPDIVFTDYPNYPSLYTKLHSYLRLRRTPIVAWLLGDFWIEHDLAKRELKWRDSWQETISLVAWMTGMKQSDVLLIVCNWLLRRVARRFRFTKLAVLYYGVDPKPWAADLGHYEFEHPAVGILQNNVIKPKVMGLLRFSEVIKRMSDVNFYIAGGGPYTHLVEEAFQGLQNVQFVGELRYPAGVAKFYKSCDVYVLASGLDCCPASLLEASLSSVPIVASRVGGIPELVIEGETGWTVPNAQVDEWTNRIQTLLENRELACRVAARAKAHVLQNFTWQRRAQTLVELFEGLLS